MTSTAIRAGLTIQPGPPGPTAALTGAWPPVTAPPLVDADGGLDMADSSEWSEQ